MDLNKLEEFLVIPEHDKSTPVKRSEAEFIHHFLVEKKITKTLEIGLGYGRSALYIMHATQSPHIAIDPYQKKYNNQALTNIENAGFHNLFTHVHDFSHFALPALCAKSDRFNFIFIDGDHKLDGILIDFYFSSMLLDKGGYILFHDTWMRSTQLVTSFIKNNRSDFETYPTPLPNLHLIRKTGDDNRDGMYFKEFYTLKSMIKYNLIKMKLKFS